MWTHASETALMDVLDGTAGDGVLAHVQSCARCRARVEEARGGLAWTEQVTVPEPVPSYWDMFRRHVARRIAETPAAPSRRPVWAAAGAAAAIVAAVLTVMPGPVVPTGDAVVARALPRWTPLPPAEEDPALLLLEEAVPAAAASAATLECIDVDECVTALTEEESRDLADALRQQLAGGRAL